MTNPKEQMSLYACVVRAKLKNVKESNSTSGLVLHPEQGIIISHGSILCQLVDNDANLKSAVTKGKLLTEKLLDGSRFEILLDSRWGAVSQVQLPAVNMMSSPESDSVRTQSASATTSHLQVSGRFLGAFRNEYFHKAMMTLMPEHIWKFSDDESVSDDSPLCEEKELHNLRNITDAEDIPVQLMSYFTVFKIVSLEQNPEMSTFSFFKNVSNQSPCRVSDNAEIIATPFGGLSPGVFFNSYSRGVVCNVSGPTNCWILSDARCIPGSEGGPLFTWRNECERCVTGIITASMCWKNNDWIGFSVACSLHSILQSMLKFYKTNKFGPNILSITDNTRFNSSVLNENMAHENEVCCPQIQRSTVRVQVGGTWGSGIVLHPQKGIILTCSHVVKEADIHTVKVRPFQSDMEYSATVVYRQHPLTGPFDVAVLRCTKATTASGLDAVMEIAQPKLGERVFAVGHALFNREDHLEPSVTSGHIAKILHLQGRPLMVQTSCAVHPGASGGPLLTTSGQLVGILVCNTRDNSNNTSFPHINMVAPAVTIWPSLHKYIQTGDKIYLHTLQLRSSQSKKLWALGNPIDTSENPIKSRL